VWYLVYRWLFWSLLEDDENLRGRNARPSSKKGMEMRWQQTRTDLKGWLVVGSVLTRERGLGQRGKRRGESAAWNG
jgi:hypothetical protein